MTGEPQNHPDAPDARGKGSEQIERARRVAAAAHAGQSDKLGQPYLTHCERVAQRVAGEEAQTVALLHDVIEKGESWTPQRLRDEGFSPDVVDAVELLTRQPNERDDSYLMAIAANPLASLVKVADIEDNIDQMQRSGGDASRYRSELRAVSRMTGIAPQQSEVRQPSRNPVKRAVRSLLVELGLKPAGR